MRRLRHDLRLARLAARKLRPVQVELPVAEPERDRRGGVGDGARSLAAEPEEGAEHDVRRREAQEGQHAQGAFARAGGGERRPALPGAEDGALVSVCSGGRRERMRK